jgi:hypothetical protein
MTINSHILVGLRQGAHISQCLTKGQTREDLVSYLEGDEQLVDMWISFLNNDHWIEWSQGNGWSFTAKGKLWSDKLSLSTTLPDHDELSMLHDSAEEAFGLIKSALLESGIEPNLWSMLRFLLDHAEEPPFNFSIRVESGNFTLVIASDSGDGHTLVFVKELLSLIFQEMAGVGVDVSALSENAIKLRARTQGPNKV